MKNENQEKEVNRTIKALAQYRGVNLTKLCEMYNARYGTKYSAGSFRNKLNQEKRISYVDVQRFGEILGFTVNITLNEGNQFPICQSS